MQEHAQKHLWRGRRVYAIDGTKLNLPRSFIWKKYQLLRKSLFYPQGLATVLYDVTARLPVTATLSRNTNERDAVSPLLKAINPGDVVIYDCGYLSTNLLNLHQKSGIDAVFRVQPSSFKELNSMWTSKHREEIVDIARKNLNIRLRVIRYKAKGSTILLASTLLDKVKFPTAALIKLYAQRWRIEEGYKTLKRTLETEKWHSYSAVGVKQELFANLIAFFFTRLFELSGRRTQREKKSSSKPSERVAQKVVKDCFLNAETMRFLDLSTVRRLYQIAERFKTISQLRRSFERISHRPESKFRPSKKKTSCRSKSQSLPTKKRIAS